MKNVYSSLLCLAALLAVTLSGCVKKGVDHFEESDPDQFQKTNLFARQIGLGNKEVALTLDDGPGARSLELARWLAAENVPTTFFMVGKNAAANPGAVEAISELKLPDGTRAHIIANHSMTHAYSLSSNTSRAIGEISNADKILAKYIDKSGVYLFRPPFGAFVEGGGKHVDAVNNASDLKKYIGPIFWDVGGAMSGSFSADWACWPKHSVRRCHDGYVAETKARGGGVILLHDIHSKTVDMLMGTNGAPSLIKSLKNAGFKFVALNKNKEALSRYGTVADNDSDSSDKGTVYFASAKKEENSVFFKIFSPGADRLEVFVDRLSTHLVPPIEGDKAEFTYKFTGAGNRFMTVKAYKDDKLVAQKTFPFMVE